MAYYFLDFVKETTNTSGSGSTYTLAGAVTNYKTFVSAATAQIGAGPWTGHEIYYFCYDGAGTWEAGSGLLTDAASDTLDRDTIYMTSNGNTTKISWPTTDAKNIISWTSSIALNKLILNREFVTFTDADATPSVLLGKNFKTANTGATTITMLDDGIEGQEVFVVINDANTTIDFTATNLKGNAGADWTPGSGDTMRCTFDGTNWYCVVNNTS